jgi:hypothetical protein
MSPLFARITYVVAAILTVGPACTGVESMGSGGDGGAGSTAMVATGTGGTAAPDGGPAGTSGQEPVTGVAGTGSDAGAQPEVALPIGDASGAAGSGAAGSGAGTAGSGAGTAGSSSNGAAGTGAAIAVYEAESGRISGDADREDCSGCSGGRRVSFGEDSVLTLYDVEAGNGGTKMVLLRYTNATDRDLSLYVGVNGNPSQSFWWIFKPTGGWDKVSSVALALSGFRPGSNNSITFFIDTELDAPALDRIEILPDPSVAGTNYCDRAHWEATASVTAGDGGGPMAAVDGDLKTRWANNHDQNGTDWFQVDFGGLVKLANVTLDNSQGYGDDYPGKYAIYGSVDGVTFDAQPFVTGDGKPTRTIADFKERTARAIKIMQVGTTRASRWWQISELTVGCRM